MEIGIDIIETNRIKKLIRNKKFINRIFSKDEIFYCSKKKYSTQHFAVRFACKEAVWKALNNKKISLKNITVINDKTGKPAIKISGENKHLGEKIKISLSHTKNYAVAVAIYQNTKSVLKK